MAVAKKKGAKTVKVVTPVQEALQITFVLKGNLKRAQLMYLFIARQLAKVRERSLYAALGHKDMEEYAHQRLDLGRSSLYNYLHIYDWVSKSHPEWLGKNVKGKIPDLSDIADLMWIETALTRSNLDPQESVRLEALQKKALAGTLRRNEIRELKTAVKPVKDQLADFLAALRQLRKKAVGLPGLPPEAVPHLEAVIGLISNAQPLKVARLDLPASSRKMLA
jgi:hypothetical protein